MSTEKGKPHHGGATKAGHDSHHAVHHAPEKKEITITLPGLSGINSSSLATIAAVILLVVVLFQSFQAWSLASKVDGILAEAREAARPPSVDVTTITTDCADCTPVSQLLSTLGGGKVNITRTVELRQNDAAARQLIAGYDIKRLPAVIVKGEIDKAAIQGFAKVKDALVYQQTPPPYLDALSGEVKGIVTLTYVNVSSCRECPDLTQAVQQLMTQAKVGKFSVVDYGSGEGKKVASEFSMMRLPGILVSGDVMEYPIGAQLAQVGTTKKGGAIALGANPPYFNVTTGRIDGVARMVLLNDSSCSGCYDVRMHQAIVEGRFQIYLETVSTIDAGSKEGMDMITRYNVTALPTVILTGDLSLYAQLTSIWPGVGTVEKDGAYVFREMGQISGSPYKDVMTGKIIPNLPPQGN